MNINTLDKYETGLKDVQWQRIKATIANINLYVLLPYRITGFEPDCFDLRNSKIEDIGWIGVLPIKRGNCTDFTIRGIWMSMIKTHYKKYSNNYPLILDANFYNEQQRKNKDFEYYVKTPYGKPGNPMTMLFDELGELVPSLYFPSESNVRILLLDHDWNSFSWNSNHPAVALQFMNGKYEETAIEKRKWEGFVMRNKV